jgi:hypothetical protein
MIKRLRRQVKTLFIRGGAFLLTLLIDLYRKIRPIKEGMYFCYNQSIHHIHHTLFIAIELSNIQNQYPVTVLSTSHEASQIIEGELAAIPNRVRLIKIKHPWYRHSGYHVNWFVFLCRLRMHRPLAVVVTEYFDNVFRQLNVKTAWIFTSHGPENRGFSHPHIKDYDLVFCASEEDARRVENLIGPLTNYQAFGYSKLDYLYYHPNPDRQARKERPTIIYNPHFDKTQSSFYQSGLALLRALSNGNRYDILFMPHPDLSRKHPRLVQQAAQQPQVTLIDRPKINFDYFAEADLYITDVSSAAYEWLVFNRPVVFFNPQLLSAENGRLLHIWTCGPVVNNIPDVLAAIDRSLQHPEDYQGQRKDMLRLTFTPNPPPVSRKIALAIHEYITKNRRDQTA